MDRISAPSRLLGSQASKRTFVTPDASLRGRDAPQPECSVGARGRYQRLIRAKDDVLENIGVADQVDQVVPGFRIPDLYRPWPDREKEKGTVRAEYRL